MVRQPDSLNRTLTALANPHRRLVIQLLRVHALRAGELAARAAMGLSAMSQHLRTLRLSGLIADTRDTVDSRIRIYELCPAPILELQAWLDKLTPLGGAPLKREPRRRGQRD